MIERDIQGYQLVFLSIIYVRIVYLQKRGSLLLVLMIEEMKSKNRMKVGEILEDSTEQCDNVEDDNKIDN